MIKMKLYQLWFALYISISVMKLLRKSFLCIKFIKATFKLQITATKILELNVWANEGACWFGKDIEGIADHLVMINWAQSKTHYFAFVLKVAADSPGSRDLWKNKLLNIHSSKIWESPWVCLNHCFRGSVLNCLLIKIRQLRESVCLVIWINR